MKKDNSLTSLENEKKNLEKNDSEMLNKKISMDYPESDVLIDMMN